MTGRIAVLVTLLCMTHGSFLFAQSEEKQLSEEASLLDFGLKTAVSLPSFFWFEDNSWNNATGTGVMPAAWAFVAVNFTDAVSLQIEAGYNGKGCYVKASDGKLLWWFSYLEMPVMIKYSVSLSSVSQFWIAGGGYFARFLGGRYKFDVPGSEWIGRGTLSTGTAEKVTEIRPYDYGLLLSAGSMNGNFVYEFRFPFGLTPVLAFTPADGDYGGYRMAVNSGFLLSVGYQF